MNFRELSNRLSSMINRCVLAGIEAGHKNQKWLVRGVESQDKEVEVFELYGSTSSPPVNGQSEALRFSLEGYEDHSIALGATGGSFRPQDLKPGEVVHYTQWDKGSKHRVHFHAEKQGISLMAGDNVLTLDNERLLISIGGNTVVIDANGLTSPQDGTFAGVSVETHTHGGVDTGVGDTDQPN